MYLFGKNTVKERIKSGPGTIKRLYLRKGTDLSDVARAAKKAGIHFESVDRKWVKERFRNVNTQGVIAKVSEFQYAPVQQLIKDCAEDRSTMVFVDKVTDPQNLGGLIRNLACMGGISLVLPKHGSVHVNETVLRVASGGENFMPVSIAPNLRNAIQKAKNNNIWIAGTAVDEGSNIIETDLPFPLALVIGSEGRGIRPVIKKELDLCVLLPMSGAPLSYNVTVAAALLCFEICRRR